MLLDRAFRVDFERNGPSLFRLMQTMMRRWQRYRSDADPRVRARVKVAATQLRTGYGAALWAMERYLRAENPSVSERIRALRLDSEREIWRHGCRHQSGARPALAVVIQRFCSTPPIRATARAADFRRKARNGLIAPGDP